jgi:N-acetyl-gamma-glutamylphosphate reductase
MHVVLIGGSGLIGPELARRLKRRSDIELHIFFDKATSHAFPNIGVIGDVQSIDDPRNVFI